MLQCYLYTLRRFPEGFNVGFIETRTSAKKMAHHSDCSIDLDENSDIGIISNKEITIEFKDKETKEVEFVLIEPDKNV